MKAIREGLETRLSHDGEQEEGERQIRGKKKANEGGGMVLFYYSEHYIAFSISPY